MNRHAHLVEIFASVQGEGVYIGQPQVFLRLAGCPIRCRYCDTPAGLERTREYALRLSTGVRMRPSPAGLDEVVEALHLCDEDVGAVRPLSVTGGEPLLQASALAELLPALRGERRIHLETAGIHPAGLASVKGAVDHLSMDWKLPSTLEAGDFRERHEECLDIALEAVIETCVKIVLSPAITGEELRDALRRIRARSAEIAVVLQPECASDGRPRIGERELAKYLAIAEAEGASVRFLPQLHKLLGLP